MNEMQDGLVVSRFVCFFSMDAFLISEQFLDCNGLTIKILHVLY